MTRSTTTTTTTTDPPHTHRILIVDDEPALLRLLGRMIGGANRELLLASDGATALSLAQADPARPIDLLVTDLILPGMRGDELAQALRGEHPTLAILFVSGHATFQPRDRFEPPASILVKPFGPAQLRAAVEELLAALPR